MWEVKSLDTSIHRMTDVYQWSVGSGEQDGSLFTVFLATLNTPPCFAGHCDWRIPNEDGLNPPFTGALELESILAPGGREVPWQFRTGGFGGCTVTECSLTAQDYYWTGSTGSLAGLAWAIQFGSAEPYLYDNVKTHFHHARAVRNAP